MSSTKHPTHINEIKQRLQKDVEGILKMVDIKSFEEKHSTRDETHLDVDKILTMTLTEIHEAVPAIPSSSSISGAADLIEDTLEIRAETFIRPAKRKTLPGKIAARVNETFYTLFRRFEF